MLINQDSNPELPNKKQKCYHCDMLILKFEKDNHNFFTKVLLLIKISKHYLLYINQSEEANSLRIHQSFVKLTNLSYNCKVIKQRILSVCGWKDLSENIIPHFIILYFNQYHLILLTEIYFFNFMFAFCCHCVILKHVVLI